MGIVLFLCCTIMMLYNWRKAGEGMYYIEGKCQDPCYNLALEEYIMETRKEGAYLILWSNKDSIIMGSIRMHLKN